MIYSNSGVVRSITLSAPANSGGLCHLKVNNPQFAEFGSKVLWLPLLQITFVQRLLSGSGLFSASWAEISCYEVLPLKSDLPSLPDIPEALVLCRTSQ